MENDPHGGTSCSPPVLRLLLTNNTNQHIRLTPLVPVAQLVFLDAIPSTLLEYTVSPMTLQKVATRDRKLLRSSFPVRCVTELTIQSGESITLEGPPVKWMQERDDGALVDVARDEQHAVQVHLLPAAALQEGNIFLTWLYTETSHIVLILTNIGARPWVFCASAPLADAVFVPSLWNTIVPALVFTHEDGRLPDGGEQSVPGGEKFLPTVQLDQAENVPADRSAIYFRNGPDTLELLPNASSATLFKTDFKQIIQPGRGRFFMYLPPTIVETVTNNGYRGRGVGRQLAICNTGLIDPGYTGNILVSMRAWHRGSTVRIPPGAQLSRGYYLATQMHVPLGMETRKTRGPGGFGSSDQLPLPDTTQPPPTVAPAVLPDVVPEGERV